MYDYFDELNKVLNAIDTLVSRTRAGVINVPVEELDNEETDVQFMVKRIKEKLNTY